jgi:hypothetical protein
MPNGEPLSRSPTEPALLRRVAEVESEAAELLAELRERVRSNRESCGQARELRREWQRCRPDLGGPLTLR